MTIISTEWVNGVPESMPLMREYSEKNWGLDFLDDRVVIIPPGKHDSNERQSVYYIESPRRAS